MTTATIMRSKQTSGTSIGRPIHTTRSQYNGGVIYPQWMRSLEEKYQRIHMKIARSTTAMSNIYNSSLGRNSNQEKTLVKASLAKPRESSPGRFSTTQLQYRRVASCVERGVSRTRTSVTDFVTGQGNSHKQDAGFTPAKQEDLQFANVDEIDIDKTDVKFNDDVINLCDDIDKEECDSNSSRVDDEENIGFVLGLGHVKNVSSDEDDDEIEKDTNDIKHFEEEQVFNSKENTLLIEQDYSAKEGKTVDYKSRPSLRDTYKLSPVKGEPRKHFITQLGKHYQNKPEQFIRREQIPRTSTSRRSIQTHKTSKSCPATMEHVKAAPQPQTNRATQVRSKSSKKSYKGQRNSNMFSRMSMEAQHARTEILKEKSPSKKQQQQQQQKRNSTSQKLSGCDEGSSGSKEAHSEKQSEVVVQNNEKTSQNKAVDRLYNGEDNNKMFTDIPDYEQAYSDSEISVGNRKHAFAVLANRTKLPNITDGKYVTLQHLKTLQYTLPGIGRYSVAPKRETTFEITPPGFDIRYKDMMVLEERESETPPPDIRNRAVQKCQEWLARHTPR